MTTHTARKADSAYALHLYERTISHMVFPKHDPRDSLYRSPVGAAANNSDITLTIDIPLHFRTKRASVCLQSEENRQELSMEKLSCESCDRFSLTIPADETFTGLLFYCFILQSEGGEPYYYGKMDPNTEHPEITGGIYNEIPPMWQITVYDKNFTVPMWYGEGITYQIFPDRFARTHIPRRNGCKAERVIRPDWYGGIPEYRPVEDDIILNNDFFGGNIRGIMEKLDYLDSLGVRTIYLNPIFEAQSNHRYDTANYEKLDPMFGTEKQFEELCKKAKKRGMHVILDGVFSHTGADSIYFNKYGHYDSIGAYQSKESPYYSWYQFKEYPDEYECWWDVLILPATKEMEPSYLDYIVRGSESIVRKWIRLGASGWRLDVADELPDAFIRALRKAVKEENPEAIVIGEVWEDASNKVSYDTRRRYFEGQELDSVMNYPLKDAILAFMWGGDALDFRTQMELLQANYPKQVFFSLMNHIGTHDTTRILTNLGFRGDGDAMGRDGRAVYRMTEQERSCGKSLLRLATVIQFTFPGSPTIYYGDEAGMEGFEDPFNRMCYPWGEEDLEVQDWYRMICSIRNGSEALRKGELHFLYALGDLLAYERRYGDELVTIIINRGDSPAVLPFAAEGVDLLSGESALTTAQAKSAYILKKQ